MSRARDFADLAGSSDTLINAGKNLIINGDMSVWQRGTTIDSIASGEYFCDRWRFGHNDLDGNVDVDRSTDVPSGQGFGYSQKISMDASEVSLDADDNLVVATRFEGQYLQHLLKGTSYAKSITLSFWVKSSVAATYTVNIYDADNQRQISATYVINTANTWEYKTITFAGDTTGALDNDNNRSIDFGFWIDAGSNWSDGTFATSWQSYTKNNRFYGTTGWLQSVSPVFYLTGVKLEVGSTATPFQHESYAENLAKCQRYYVQQTTHIQTPAGGSMIVPIYFPTTMRATPTTSNIAAGSGGTGLTFEGLSGLHTQGAYFQVASSANSNYRTNRIDEYVAEL